MRRDAPERTKRGAPGLQKSPRVSGPTRLACLQRSSRRARSGAGSSRQRCSAPAPGPPATRSRTTAVSASDRSDAGPPSMLEGKMAAKLIMKDQIG